MSSFRVTDHSKGGLLRTPDEIRAAFCATRGAITPAQSAEFVAPRPAITNSISLMAGFERAVTRLQAARRNGESVTIFGDYDCDGVTSLVQIYDVLKAWGHKALRLYIPERFTEDYGLTRLAADNCIEQQKPSVIFTVDCGSSSSEVIEYLKGRGVDVIVLDHHMVPPSEKEHPAVAHLNPKGYPDDTPIFREMREMSAAGLSFLFAEAFAQRLGVTQWDRRRSLILGGLGTMVDVMKVDVPINRALVKHSLALANSPALNSIPGLRILGDTCKVQRFDTFAYGFVIGPHLNASGRLDTAQTSARLLAVRTFDAARPFVPVLVEHNRDRKEKTQIIQTEAVEMAEDILTANPEARVLLLANPAWHTGIVGIVASRIKEKFKRPAFVCGMVDDKYMKGSGRSMKGVDLGQIVHRARQEGVLVGGGGHAMAAGIKFDATKFTEVSEWFDEVSRDLTYDMGATYEVLGSVELLPAHEWVKLFASLEPFGNGNERPHLLAENAELVDGPTPLQKKDDSHEVWGWRAGFVLPNGQKLTLTWKDSEEPAKEWSAGQKYRMIVSLKIKVGDQGTVWENWNVEACEAMAV